MEQTQDSHWKLLHNLKTSAIYAQQRVSNLPGVGTLIGSGSTFCLGVGVRSLGGVVIVATGTEGTVRQCAKRRANNAMCHNKI